MLATILTQAVGITAVLALGWLVVVDLLRSRTRVRK